ncbi:hypothetical protein L249_3298 [Ophiocordyceps polyrhachis-furcata BCC 54312]|uniref:Protamine P1 n=1 Tax=Ophiocordyceps polyrhachis-furcata BCC 54312 TaxID=1330021 RepID=A0A367LQC6_9HYPO|nr:hypothetical protein L249_3298 [Ophiocordyceps polyrhachis-furcata BCC 54312]
MALPMGNVIGDDEIFYHGSDDEDYPDPQTRQLRYRSAGERYLDNDIPFLLSASLRGPFDQLSGWDNPWKSRRRCEPCSIISTTLNSSKEKPKTDSVSRSGGKSTADSLQCHLPSPESLRQASVSEPHLFLQGQGLYMVQRWRQGIQPPSLTQDSFWASTNAQKNSSAKKRRAVESAWLKRRTNKKRKPNLIGRQISKKPALSSGDAGDSSPSSESCSSAFEASSPCRPRLVDSDDLIDQVELPTSTVNASFDGISTQVTPNKKPTSSSHCVSSSANGHLHGAAGEPPRQSEANVVTVSSPISRQSKMSAYVLGINKRKKRSPTPVTTKASLSPEEPSSGETTASDGDGWRQDARSIASKGTCRLQTQHDQSFCFKIRSAAEDAPEDQMLTSEPTQQPESPALAESGNQCRPPAIGLPDDVHSLEQRMTQSMSYEYLVRADKDGLRIKEAERPERHRMQSPQESTYGLLEHDGLAGDGSEAKKASSTISVEDKPLFTAPSGSSRAREESVTRCECRDGEETGPANNITSPPATAQHNMAANQQKDHDSELTPGPQEALESGPWLSGSRSALLPNHQSNTPTRPRQTCPMSPTDGTPQRYTLKLLLNHLVPASPWAKLSHLARSSGSTATWRGSQKINMGETEAVDESTQALISASQQSPWVGRTPVTNKTIVSFPEQIKDDADTEMSGCKAVDKDDVWVTGSQQSPWTALPPSTSLGQQQAAVESVLHEGLELNEGQGGELQDSKTTASQQSPWTETQSREPIDRVAARRSSPAGLSNQRCSGDDQRSCCYVGTENASMPALGLASSSPSIVVTSSQLQISRPHTPEPQFAVKPFASFITPSPERHPRALRSRACTMGGLASALKNPWSGNTSRPDRRVSWAPPPLQGDEERARTSSSLPSSTTSTPLPLPSAARSKARPVSPPPPLNNDSLPPSTKFSRHFAIAASRRRSLPSLASSPVLPCSTSKLRLIPTASQQGQTPGPRAMAEAFLAADDAATSEQQNQPQEPQQEAPLDGKDGVGVVDDLLRDMGDFFLAMDADAELDQAREDARASDPEFQTSAYQSPS